MQYQMYNSNIFNLFEPNTWLQMNTEVFIRKADTHMVETAMDDL